MWLPEQEEILFQLASNTFPKNWKQIAKLFSQHFPQSNKKWDDCKNRYEMLYEPSNDQWSDRELFVLQQSVDEYGPEWKLMQQFLPGKSHVALKNKFYGTMKYFLRTIWKCMGRKPSKRIRYMLPNQLMKIYNSKGTYSKYKQLVKQILNKINFKVNRNSIQQIIKTHHHQLISLLQLIHEENQSSTLVTPIEQQVKIEVLHPNLILYNQ